MTYKEIIAKVANDTGLPVTLVGNTYKAFWRVVKEHISSLPLKEDITEDEFNNMQPNVNIPSLGKYYVTWENYCKIKEIHKSITSKKDKENATYKED